MLPGAAARGWPRPRPDHRRPGRFPSRAPAHRVRALFSTERSPAMPGGTPRSLNLDELMAKIRAEVGARAQAPSPAAPPAAPQVPVALVGARARIQQLLETAARYAPLSSLRAEFAGWGRLKKSVAVPTSWAVAYLTRFITSKQSLFNQAILD